MHQEKNRCNKGKREREKIRTIFTLALLDLVLILHVLVARLAVVPSSFHLFMVDNRNVESTL